MENSARAVAARSILVSSEGVDEGGGERARGGSCPLEARHRRQSLARHRAAAPLETQARRSAPHAAAGSEGCQKRQCVAFSGVFMVAAEKGDMFAETGMATACFRHDLGRWSSGALFVQGSSASCVLSRERIHLLSVHQKARCSCGKQEPGRMLRTPLPLSCADAQARKSSHRADPWTANVPAACPLASSRRGACAASLTSHARSHCPRHGHSCFFDITWHPAGRTAAAERASSRSERRGKSEAAQENGRSSGASHCRHADLALLQRRQLRREMRDGLGSDFGGGDAVEGAAISTQGRTPKCGPRAACASTAASFPARENASSTALAPPHKAPRQLLSLSNLTSECAVPAGSDAQRRCAL
jgi:hypothetical protein